MRPDRWLALPCALLVVASCHAAPRGIATPRPAPSFRPGEVIVGLEANGPRAAQAMSAMQAKHGLAQARAKPRLNARVYRAARTADVPKLCAELRKLPGVRFAEPNYRRRVLLAAPNDVAYTNLDSAIAPFDVDATPTWFQWGMHVIQALEAWGVYPNTYYTALTRPAGAPKIAVIDTGLDVGGGDGTPQPDLINSGGTSCNVTSGGQVDLADAHNVLVGYDPSDASDDYGHGTAVAAILGAATNNGGASPGNGMAGLAYNCQIMPIKAIDGTGNGTEENLADGIMWAVDHGAVVINISAGDYFYSQLEQDAIDYAWQHGVLVCSAAGNDGSSSTPLYPAACSGVMAVAATTWPDDYPASYSNSGYYVGISAPGGDASLVPLAFWLTWTAMPTEYVPMHEAGWPPGEGSASLYQYQAGTSVSCPFVAGLAGLYASYRGFAQGGPHQALAMYQALQRGCDNAGGVAGWSPNWGWGRINAYQTMLDRDNRGSTVGSIAGQLTSYGSPAQNVKVTAYDTGTTTQRGAATTKSDGMYRIAALPPGSYDLTASHLGNSLKLVGIQVRNSCDTPHVQLALPQANTPPTAPTGVAIDPATPTSAQDLTATADGSTDAEGDTLTYSYEWASSPDGATWGAWGRSLATLAAADTTRGEQWKARARAYDGEAYSDWLESSAVTIGNAPPTAPTVAISPAMPTTRTDLVATAKSSTDADGDTVTYGWVRWTKNGSPQGGYDDTKTVPAAALTVGDVWRCEAKGHDGTDYGEAGAAEVTVGLPVEVIASRPTPGATNVSPTQRVFLKFSEPMWKAKVEAKLTFTSNPGTGAAADVPVSFLWYGTTSLYLLPEADLAFNTPYEVRLGGAACTPDGRPLGPDFVLNFTTSDSLILSHSPASDAVSVARTGAVAITFRWPVRQTSAESHFGLTDSGGTPVLGTFTWTRPLLTMVFRPDAPLLANEAYDATMRPGTRLGDGRIIIWPETFAFTTGNEPVVLAYSPRGTGVGLASDLTATFDRPMHRLSVQSNFAVTPAVAGAFSWRDAGQTVVFNPTEALAASTTYRVTIGAAGRGADGLILGRAFSWTFTTGTTALAAAAGPVTVTAAAASAGATAQVTVRLSAAAKVQVTVRNLSGRIVATLPEQPLPQGLSTLLWNGRGTHGTATPRGMYLVTVEARSRDGSMSRAIVPLPR